MLKLIYCNMQNQARKNLIKEKLLKFGFKLLHFSTRLDFPGKMFIGRFIGRRLMQLDAQRSRIAAINIDTCLPLLSPQQHREILQEYFEHVGVGIMEMAVSWWTPKEEFDPLIQVRGIENLERAFARGNGVILATAQFTTPEILSRFLGQTCQVTAIYHPHQNVSIDERIRSHRSRQLHKVLMHEDITAITQTLRVNQAVLFTHDMVAGHKQFTFADFFKIPAATNTAISRFARMTGAEVIPVIALRRADNEGYNIIFESALPDFPGESVEKDIQRLNNVIERWVDSEPAQYGWSYPRFRERPKGEPRFY